MQRLTHLIINDLGFAFHPMTGHSYKLNQTAQFILQLCQTAHEVNDIADQLATRFQVSFAEAYIDVVEFREKLLALQLLEPEPPYGTDCSLR